MAEYVEREALRNAHIYLNEEGVAVIDVEDIPAADVQPVKHGRWEEIDVQDVKNCTITSMRCNKCNRYNNKVYFYGNPTDNALFCPHCGARMDGET